MKFLLQLCRRVLKKENIVAVIELYDQQSAPPGGSTPPGVGGGESCGRSEPQTSSHLLILSQSLFSSSLHLFKERIRAYFSCTGFRKSHIFGVPSLSPAAPAGDINL